MKTSTRILLSSVMSILLAVPSTAFAQSRSAARPAQPARSATSKPSQPASRPSNNSSSSSSRQTVKNVNPQPAKSTVTPAKPSGNKASQSSLSSGTRSSGASNAQPAPVRPSGSVNSPAKPAATPAKPAGSNATPSRPAATPAKPAGSTTAPKPSGSTTAPSRPPGNSSTGNSGSPSNPSFSGGGRQPQQPSKPNAAPSNPGNKPGSSSPSMNNRPGGNSAPKPGATVKPQPNHPAPPPYRPSVSRPHYNYAAPGYRPPRPNGGYWGAPPVNIYRPVFYRPVPPPRPAVISYVYPSVTSILGLAFGSFLDAGINALYTAGYNVLGYADNMVYLSNVSQLGYIWPEATVYYTDGLMSNTQFQYWTTYYDTNRFNSVYNLLTNTYGYPVNNYTENGIRYVNWWAGGDTAYITLQYGPGLGNNGRTTYYYTTLTYSDYY